MNTHKSLVLLTTLVGAIRLIGCGGTPPAANPASGDGGAGEGGAAVGGTGGQGGAPQAGSENLLCNPGFEEGDTAPDCWETFSPGGEQATFTWEQDQAQSGSRSVSVATSAPELAMWQQVVAVEPDQVYLLSGYTGFEDILSPGQCNLQVVFRDASDQLIELINYPHHDGTRAFDLDFPTDLKVRAPAKAATAEVNLFLAGPGKALFDDIHFGLAPLGTIAGTVTNGSQPLAGARVVLHGDHWGRSYEATTDAEGDYEILEVPVAFPRYILLASKDGYRTRSRGRVEVAEDAVVTVDFALEPGLDPVDDLRVKVGTLSLRQYSEPVQVPETAVIPADASGYPEAVRVYLEPSEAINADHPDVVARAEQILATVTDPTSTHDVAWAVYEWVSRNIDHDGVYSVAEAGGLDQPFKDETSGIWQTISGDGRGWSFGRTFADWTYKPDELLRVRGGICVEHAMLVSALLRALKIPARPFSGSMEFWAQVPGEGGDWYAMSTTGGRTGYREHGQLGPNFAGGRLTTFPVTAGPMVHEDWNRQNEGLWRESHPWGVDYPATTEGHAQAVADLEQFELTGEAPTGQPVAPGQDRYRIHYRDVTLNLYDMGEQRELSMRFPKSAQTDSTEPLDHQAYWTNHPECVTGTSIEVIENPPVEGKERWVHVELNVSPLLD